LPWLHKGWLSRLRATSSLSFIGFEQPSRMDFRLMKLMTTMVKSLDWYRFHPMRMILLLQTRVDKEDWKNKFSPPIHVFDVDRGGMIEWVIDQDEWKVARTLRSLIA
jgi:hypothetical protein